MFHIRMPYFLHELITYVSSSYYFLKAFQCVCTLGLGKTFVTIPAIIWFFSGMNKGRNSFCFHLIWKTFTCRPVVPGCAMAHPNFGRSVNPISTRGDRLCPPNYTTATPGFSNLPTALKGYASLERIAACSSSRSDP